MARNSITLSLYENLEAVRYIIEKTNIIKYIDKEDYKYIIPYISDYNIILRLIKYDHTLVYYIHDSIKFDIALCIHIYLVFYTTYLKSKRYYPTKEQYKLTESTMRTFLKNNKDINLYSLYLNQEKYISFVRDYLFTDDFLKTILPLNGYFLCFGNRRQRYNVELQKLTIYENDDAYYFVTDEQATMDEEIGKIIIGKVRVGILFTKNLRTNKEFVKWAVANYPYSISYIPELLLDEDILRIAITHGDKDFIRYITSDVNIEKLLNILNIENIFD